MKELTQADQDYLCQCMVKMTGLVHSYTVKNMDNVTMYRKWRGGY